MIFNLISSPRNVSTALMYAFYHRGDMKVFDEPYYGYYLKRTGADHPGREEIIASMELDIQKIDQSIINSAKKSHVFVKNMAHHFLDFDLPTEDHYLNIFLIRNPIRIINSFSKVIENPTLTDIGVKRQYELLEYAKANHLKFVIVDSTDLLLDPEKHMEALCEALSLPLTSSMTKWESGSIPADGIWAKYWYQSVHTHQGLERQEPQKIKLDKQYHKLQEEAMFYFEILSKDKITF